MSMFEKAMVVIVGWIELIAVVGFVLIAYGLVVHYGWKVGRWLDKQVWLCTFCKKDLRKVKNCELCERDE